jgi:NAD(P)H-flavin reductase
VTSAEAAIAGQAAADPMLPVAYRVTQRRTETSDITTLWLAPENRPIAAHRPGQFTMLYQPGLGEIPISISGPAEADDTLVQTIRAVGPISRALHAAPVGAVIGVRGPFGTHWDLAAAQGGDVVVIGGGCGLAPLRPVLLALLAERSRYRRVVGVLGARVPEEFSFAGEISGWAGRADLELVRTVDVPAPGWAGAVGLVTQPLEDLVLETEQTMAFLCGPEVMIRAAAELLRRRGLAENRIQVSMERNMKCAVGHCGHCQLGPLLLCRDGPVLSYAVARPLMAVREL